MSKREQVVILIGVVVGLFIGAIMASFIWQIIFEQTAGTFCTLNPASWVEMGPVALAGALL